VLQRVSLLGITISVAMMIAGCDRPCGDLDCRLTATEWNIVTSMSPLPDPPTDPTNRYQFDENAAAFGHKLFFDTRYSGPLKILNNGDNGGIGTSTQAGQVACVSCHDPKRYFVDTRSVPGNVSLAVAYTGRNAPTMVNLPYYEWWGWAGRHDSMWQQASLAIETPTDTAADRCDYAHFLWRYHRSEYDAVFVETPLPAALDPTHPEAARFPAKCKPKPKPDAADGPWELMTKEDRAVILQILANQGKAVTAYETKLISRNSAFDRWVAGEQEALSPEAERGLKLFLGKAACNDCHSGYHFSDSEFHNLGVPRTGPNLPVEDMGRFADIAIYKKHPFNSASPFNDAPDLNRAADYRDPTEEDKGRFRTPTLRNVAMTGPYMHTGAFYTLTEVVEFYNGGGGSSAYVGEKDPRMAPLNLTEREIEDLVAFLESLTGEPLSEEITNNPL
jgi:cytochrome c peroxidase